MHMPAYGHAYRYAWPHLQRGKAVAVVAGDRGGPKRRRRLRVRAVVPQHEPLEAPAARGQHRHDSRGAAVAERVRVERQRLQRAQPAQRKGEWRSARGPDRVVRQV